ncbi:MAG: SWIM zinc finger family protein [Anaerolineae bacterium]
MPEPQLTEALVQGLATSKSFSRGQNYYLGGAVWSLTRRDNTLLAEVEGSSYDPYQVTVELDAGGVVGANCSCPYDWGGYCKHIVAVLLTYVHKPEKITTLTPVSELLTDLDREALVALWTDLLDTHPHLADWVEGQVAIIKQAPERTSTETQNGPRQRRTPLDGAAFRRQARAIMSSLSGMRPSEAYWHTGGMVSQLEELVQQAQPFLEAGDGRNALVILEAVAEVYVDRWLEFDDSDGYLGGLFGDLGPAFAEALLSADFSEQERAAWADKLTAWQEELDDYGIEDGFDVAIAAAVQGWDYAPLQRAMQGHIAERGAWEDESPWYADELAVVRLNVLESQGRTEEYLHLAEAEGQTARYVTMLVKLGRGQEAVAYGLKYLGTTGEALALAQALREHDLHQEAMQIAEHGLTLHGHTHTLACWLRDFAAGIGQAELALQAARAAFTSSPSLADYQAARPLAGADWPQVKADLLKHLAAQDYASAKVNIYLHEGMVDEAVKAVDKHSYGYDALERVVEAAYKSHPDWVIRKCKAQAERIMDAGQSKYYHHAVNWLGRARQAYLAAGRVDQWRTYLEGLIVKHARKYSLRPKLEALRK